MINWIRRKLGQGWRAVGDAIDAVRDVVVTMWHLLGGVFDLIRRAWAKLAPQLFWFADAVGDLAHVLYVTVRAFILRIIPKLIHVAVTAVRKWASAAINAARDLARGLFRILRDWAQRAINAVRAFLLDVWDWTRRHVLDLLDRARRIWDKVADLVLHPDKLWAWLFPHVVTPLLRFLVSRSVPIGGWLLRASVRAALGAASLIESVIVKIL